MPRGSGSVGHTAGDGVLLVAALRVLTEGAFHCNGEFHDHVVHAFAVGLMATKVPPMAWSCLGQLPYR